MNEYPLVSVVVVTYNSSKWILETLESIKDQTYKNIELIISDDCSTDNTVDIVQSWLDENGQSFVSLKLITSQENTGVTANMNRGVKECKGVWIKDLAGDDALIENAIEKYVEFVNNNQNIKICHAKSLMYKDTFEENNLLYYDYSRYNVLRDNNRDPQDKFHRLCFSNGIHGNTVFLNRVFLEKIGGYDETIRYCEDAPLYMKITTMGYNIYFMNEYTAKYRLHSNSINYNRSRQYLFSDYFEMDEYLYQKYIKIHGSKIVKFSIRYHYCLCKLLLLLHMNKSNKINRLFYMILNMPYSIAQYWHR